MKRYIGEQRRPRRVCSSAQSIRCSLTQCMEASCKEPKIWPHWIAARVRLKDHYTNDTKVLFLVRQINCLLYIDVIALMVPAALVAEWLRTLIFRPPYRCGFEPSSGHMSS